MHHHSSFIIVHRHSSLNIFITFCLLLIHSLLLFVRATRQSSFSIWVLKGPRYPSFTTPALVKLKCCNHQAGFDCQLHFCSCLTSTLGHRRWDTDAANPCTSIGSHVHASRHDLHSDQGLPPHSVCVCGICAPSTVESFRLNLFQSHASQLKSWQTITVFGPGRHMPLRFEKLFRFFLILLPQTGNLCWEIVLGVGAFGNPTWN